MATMLDALVGCGGGPSLVAALRVSPDDEEMGAIVTRAYVGNMLGLNPPCTVYSVCNVFVIVCQFVFYSPLSLSLSPLRLLVIVMGEGGVNVNQEIKVQVLAAGALPLLEANIAKVRPPLVLG